MLILPGVYSNVVPIEGTTSDALYQNYRRAATAGGSFGYRIPVPNGTYSVKLYFAEIFHNTTGKRVFNVNLEGGNWLTNYDIVARAGAARKAITATKAITISDGTVSLDFTSLVDRACVAAIQIIPTGARIAGSAAEEVVANLSARLYPNPVTNKLTAQLAAPVSQLTTTISEVTGRTRSHNSHQMVDATTLEIDVAALPPAVYLLHLQTESGRQTLKFIKQ